MPVRRPGDAPWQQAVISFHHEMHANSFLTSPGNRRLETQTPGAFQSHRLPTCCGASKQAKRTQNPSHKRSEQLCYKMGIPINWAPKRARLLRLVGGLVRRQLSVSGEVFGFLRDSAHACRQRGAAGELPLGLEDQAFTSGGLSFGGVVVGSHRLSAPSWVEHASWLGLNFYCICFQEVRSIW